MMKMLETACRLKVTEIIANINLMEETTAEMVKNGLQILDIVAKKSGVLFESYLVIENNDRLIDDNIMGKTRIVLNYYLRKPWEYVQSTGI